MNLGLLIRKSGGTMFSRFAGRSVSIPRPSGENGTNATPNSSQVLIKPISGILDHNEYSLCTAMHGCTECARRSVVGDISDNP